MMALPALLLGVLAVTGSAEVWHVYVLAFVFGVGTAFDGPARQSFVGEIVTADELTNAVGLNSASFNAARIVGPAIAGLMIGAFGGGVEATGWVIVINALSYVAPVLALRGMNPDLLRTPEPVARDQGDDPRRGPLRPRPAGPDADPRDRVLRRDVRHELPDDLRADGDRGLPQRRGRLRPARHLPRGRLADRRAARRAPHERPAAAGGRRRDGVRRARDRSPGCCRRTSRSRSGCP